MSSSAPRHRCRVIASPWPGVHSVHTDSARSFARHSHASFGIGVLAQGAHKSASGRGPVEACAGDLLASNPGEVHDGRPAQGQTPRRWHMVHLEAEVLASMTGPERPAGEVEWTHPVIRDARLRAVLVRLLWRLDRWNAGRRSDADALACEESLVQACGLMLARHANVALPAQVDRELAQVRERIADELLAPPSLAELAAMAGLGKYQLLRRFAAAYGMPPHAWLLQQRAERARRRIREGDTLAAAALASGFADQSHMTRVFARQFGFTPGAWQRAAAAGRLQ